LLSFKVAQKTFMIGDVPIGGDFGERPTVLIGSIFYEREKLLSDSRRGVFDKSKAEYCISIQEEFSDKTGNPCMIDIGGSTELATEKFIDFISSVTEAPILVGGASSKVRIAGVKYAREVGIKNPIIYNSIIPEYSPEELEVIREAKVESVIVMGFNTRDFTLNGRIKAIKSLLPKLQEVGVSKPLLDTTVIDIPSLGIASKAILKLKNELGLPSGCGAYNAIGTWRGLKVKMGVQARKPCAASAVSLPVLFGADFVIYGPIEYANFMFPAVALVDSSLAYLRMKEGRSVVKSHPLFRIA